MTSVDILEAFDEGALYDIADEGRLPPILKLRQSGVMIYDSSPRLDEVNAGHEVKLEKAAALLDSKRVRALRYPHGPDGQGAARTLRRA